MDRVSDSLPQFRGRREPGAGPDGAALARKKSVTRFPERLSNPPGKAAVRSLGRTLATELLPRRIRANTLSPGLTDTPILSRDVGLAANLRDQIARAFVSKIPMGRLGEASEMARAALFLASDDSSYVVGAELAVDGGLAQL